MSPSPPGETLLVHATAVAIGGAGVLLIGPPGSGKSDLALRLVDGGAALIADDQVMLRRDGDRLIAGFPDAAPAELRGRLEVRGLGLMPVAPSAAVPLALVVALRSGPPEERLPAPRSAEYLGVAVPLLRLDPFAASAAAQVRLAVRTPGRGIIPPQ
jgi:HPr kinase/phosphorylase